ncbi:unnamed protein product [Orchesella dallaii]|uniref:Uncharacterized protein n=1 Tax=Orchesella dallaii TaxID=48710 RepID=A0ABP1RL27_9HEXA
MHHINVHKVSITLKSQPHRHFHFTYVLATRNEMDGQTLPFCRSLCICIEFPLIDIFNFITFTCLLFHVCSSLSGAHHMAPRTKDDDDENDDNDKTQAIDSLTLFLIF